MDINIIIGIIVSIIIPAILYHIIIMPHRKDLYRDLIEFNEQNSAKIKSLMAKHNGNNNYEAMNIYTNIIHWRLPNMSPLRSVWYGVQLGIFLPIICMIIEFVDDTYLFLGLHVFDNVVLIILITLIITLTYIRLRIANKRTKIRYITNIISNIKK